MDIFDTLKVNDDLQGLIKKGHPRRW